MRANAEALQTDTTALQANTVAMLRLTFGLQRDREALLLPILIQIRDRTLHSGMSIAK